MNKALHTEAFPGRLDRLIELSILLVVFFLPLSLDMATGFLAAGSFLWLAKMFVIRKWEIGRLPFDNVLLLFVFFGSVSILGSPDRFFSSYNYGHLMGRYILLYYLVSYNVRSYEQIRQLITALLASTVIVALYGFYQYILGVDISALEWVDAEQFPDLKVRVFSTLQNPNLLAGFLVTIIAIVIGLGLQMKAADRLSMLVLVIMLAGCLVLTYSRGAWVSLAAVIGAYGLLYDRRILWLLLVGPLIMLCFNDVSSRIVSIFNPTDTSSTLRFALWESTIAMIADKPLTGIGWGVYWLVYPEYDFFIQDTSTVIFHAHNMYLHLAAEIGIPGLCAFLVFIYCHAHAAVIMLQMPCPPWIKGLLTGLIAAILGIAVSGMTDHVLFSIQMSMLAWLLFAVVISVRQAILGIHTKNSYSIEQEKTSISRNT